MTLAVPGLPELSWTHTAGSGRIADGCLVLQAAANTDWFNDPLGRPRSDRATALAFEPDGDFALSARVEVRRPRSTFDAGVLAIFSDQEHWAKLCFEFSPQGQAMVVAVVTNEYSDDCNSTVITDDAVWLRICRIGPAWAFHYSLDGMVWNFVRLFRLHATEPPVVGFLAQAPTGESAEATFADIRLGSRVPTDLRDGS